MAEPVDIHALVEADLPAYKALRDAMLAAHPEAFTSDAATERQRIAQSYLPRLGMAQAGGGSFLLGAWQSGQLVGTLGCERDTRVKVCHIGHLVGMMVRSELQGAGIGRRLLEAGIKTARGVEGMEMLTLTVTASNTAAVRLYESAGFIRFGTLPDAIKVDGRHHAKDHMFLTL
ncbi:MAG: GNAT family N-acetyltransferase [Burkholderiaceae bacterium]